MEHSDNNRELFIEIKELLKQILKNQHIMGNTIIDIQAAVAAEDTVIASAIALLQGLAAQVAALEPNQAAIDALAADITSQTASLSAAVTANTPVAPQS